MNFGSLLIFIIIACFYFFSQYFKFKSNQNKIGTLLYDFKFPNFKKNFFLWFALIMFSGFIIFEYLLYNLGTFNLSNSFLKLCFFGIIFSRTAYNRIIIGENGFYFYDNLYFWKDIDKLHWDKDIKQIQFGLKIYAKGTKIPSKLYFDREIKTHLEELFNKYSSLISIERV